jgi:hypothetical protein
MVIALRARACSRARVRGPHSPACPARVTGSLDSPQASYRLLASAAKSNISLTADSVVESTVVRAIESIIEPAVVPAVPDTESTIEPATEFAAAKSAAETESTTVSAAESIIEFTAAKSTVSYAVESDVVPDVESESVAVVPRTRCA